MINLIPYWLAPTTVIRYVQPLYPFIAVIFAVVIYQAGEAWLRQTLGWLVVGSIINVGLMIWWYPYDQTVRKGNAHAIAVDVLRIVGEQPLYTNNSGSGGLRVTAELNIIRYPAPPLHAIGPNYNGYALVNEPTDLPGLVVATYKMGGITVYLKCNGQHCPK